jgi:muramoyltetrapeptide carboxypeptidase
VPPPRLRAGLDRLGGRYRLRVADDITRADGFLAGADERRAEELQACLADPDVRAIVVARGGYGILRILDRLDPSVLRRDPKLLVGFSDATALLSWALVAAGVRGVHGPVVGQLGALDPADEAWLYQIMEGTAGAGPLPGRLAPIGDAGAGGPRRLEGPLLGGNLCLLAHLVGTPWQLPLSGAILLIEDVGERPYAVDRYLTRLGLAGALDGAVAAACGDFVRCEETIMTGHPDAMAVVDERLRRYRLPGLRGLPVGHGDRNLAVPFGGRCALDLDAGRLELIDAAVG